VGEVAGGAPAVIQTLATAPGGAVPAQGPHYSIADMIYTRQGGQLGAAISAPIIVLVLDSCCNRHACCNLSQEVRLFCNLPDASSADLKSLPARNATCRNPPVACSRIGNLLFVLDVLKCIILYLREQSGYSHMCKAFKSLGDQ